MTEYQYYKIDTIKFLFLFENSNYDKFTSVLSPIASFEKCYIPMKQ